MTWKILVSALYMQQVIEQYPELLEQLGGPVELIGPPVREHLSFEEEPLPQDSPLRSITNCLLAPHNANSSPEAHQRVHENTFKNLLNHLQSGGDSAVS